MSFDYPAAGATTPAAGITTKGADMALKPYKTTVNGYETTLMLSDEDAKDQGLTSAPAQEKQAPKAVNKARKAPNKKG